MADIDSPYQEVVKEVFSCQPMEIKRLDDGSRIGVFSIRSISPGSRTVLTQKYEIKLEGTNWLDDGRSRSIDCAGRYLEPSAKIECDDVRIRSLAWRLNPHGNLNKLDVARQAFGVTRSALTYSLDSPSANLGALAGLQAGSGCCEEYASLFVAMCRASDIPARIVNGYANGRDKLAADVKPVNLLGSRHQWAEFYLDGKGWIPVDPTLSNDEFSIFGQLPPGCYVAENYGDRQVSGKYQGGELAIQFQDRVARGY